MDMKRDILGQRVGRRGEGDQNAAAVGVVSRGRLRYIGWSKGLRYFALVEAYSRRETLMKAGHQPFYHRMMIVALLQRAWGEKRLGGL